MKYSSTTKSSARKLLTVFGIIILAIFTIILLAIALINTPFGKKQLSSVLSSATGRDVILDGSLYLKPKLPLTIHVSKLSVSNMEGARDEKMAEIGKLDLSFKFLPLFKGKFFISKLHLVDSNVHLEKNADSKANWILGDAEGKKESEVEKESYVVLPLSAVILQNSTLTYLDVPGKTDIILSAETEGQQLNLKGGGTHLGSEFSIVGDIGSLTALEQKKAVPIKTTFIVGNTTITVDGVIEDPAKLEGVDVSLHIKGADAAELFPLFGLALLPTPPYDLKGQLTFREGIWKFTGFKGILGESDLSGDLAYDTTLARPKFTAKFNSDKLSFNDLGPLIGLPPEKAVSPEQQARAIEQKASPTVIPNVPLDISKLKAMDADVEFTGKRIISGDIPIDDFYMKLILDNLTLHLTPIKFGTANGDISADLLVNARTEPVEANGEIQFRKLSLARLMEGLGKVLPLKDSEGFIGGTMKIKGYGKSLHEILSSSDGKFGLGMEGGQVSNLLVELIGLDIAQGLGFLVSGDKTVPVRCVVADFDIKKGLMQASTFVIDTSDTIIVGSGSIDLKDEKMDFVLKPEPKDGTILSLRTPIEIKGTLKKPDVNVQKANLIARAGAATGLSLLLTPLAAAAAFLEPSLGSDSNCVGMIKDMNKDNGKTREESMVPKNK